ncbi:MAG TPA: pentapeptide repeat-containing protein [Streptosporangiaceae bacterium]|nr:pentapeptide repeat-containing protein [Streptosporangiaceae bacterium]
MAWQQLADLPFARALTAHTAGLVTAETYDCAHFDGEVLEDQDGSASSFLECAFTQMTLQRCRLTRARFTDVWLSDAQLIAVSAPHASWQDVTFTGAVLAGVEVYAAQLRRVTFDRCKLDSVNFRDADLADVTFDNCVLRNIDLGGARVKRTAFPASRLAATRLVQTTLDQVDLRGAAELGLTVDPASLRGAIVTTAQLIDMAPVLAESIGITVEDQ